MRDYDPTTGRYIQADPLGLVDGASVYGYALQNPGRYVDPRGEFGVPGAVVGAAVAATSAYLQGACGSQIVAAAAAGAVVGGIGGYLLPTGSALSSGAASAVGLYVPAIPVLSCSCDTYSFPSLPEALMTIGGATIGGGVGNIVGGKVSTNVVSKIYGPRPYFGNAKRAEIVGDTISELVGATLAASSEAVANKAASASLGDAN